jgi:hypothetical protein
MGNRCGISRRDVMAAAFGTVGTLWGQMASRGVKPALRGKSSGMPFHSRLTNVAARAGLRAPVIYGAQDRNTYIIESIGCGAAFFDYDNDGWLDILLLSGTHIDGDPPGATNRLYRNNRDGTFTDVTEAAGLTRTGWAYGITVGDYNNDGFEDVFITYWGHNVLYRNNGDGTFTDVTERAGLLNKYPRFAAGCTFVDYDRDSKLDLFVSHYVGFDMKSVPPAGKDENCNFLGVPVYCGPRGLPTERCALYHNNGDGTFTDVSQHSGVAAAADSYGLTAVSADLDDDGWPDIYVACDSTPSLLFRNNRDGTFSELGLERGLALNEDGQEQAGMGIGIGDVNLDGRLDLLKTHFADDTVALYVNCGKIGFRDVTIRSGLAVETRYVSWGAGIVDLDNNGFPDLFWVTGNAYPEPERKFPQYAWRTPRVLFRNLGGGRFEQLFDEAGPALAEAHCSRGCAFGDFDNDGDIDVLIVDLNEPPSLLRNDVDGDNHWLKVRPVTGKCNRVAIGAQVTCHYGKKVQAQAVVAQSGFLSVSDSRIHFGLGPDRSAGLEIRWPSGAIEQIGDVPADRLVTIKEGAGIIKTERFR